MQVAGASSNEKTERFSELCAKMYPREKVSRQYLKEHKSDDTYCNSTIVERIGYIKKVEGVYIVSEASKRLAESFSELADEFQREAGLYELAIKRVEELGVSTESVKQWAEELKTAFSSNKKGVSGRAINEIIRAVDDSLSDAQFIEKMRAGIRVEVTHLHADILALRVKIEKSLKDVRAGLERIGLTEEEACDPLRKPNTKFELRYNFGFMIRTHLRMLAKIDAVLSELNEVMAAKECNYERVLGILESVVKELMDDEEAFYKRVISALAKIIPEYPEYNAVKHLFGRGWTWCYPRGCEISSRALRYDVQFKLNGLWNTHIRFRYLFRHKQGNYE